MYLCILEAQAVLASALADAFFLLRLPGPGLRSSAAFFRVLCFLAYIQIQSGLDVR